MKYGYARVSTDDQKADLQIAALKKADCRHIYRNWRIKLTRCLESLRAGDTLVVWKLDRLGRSLSHLVAVLAELQDREIVLLSLTEVIDTESVAGRLMGHILGALAEFERALVMGRTQAGLKAAKKRGVKLGRKPSLSDNQRKHARELLI